MNEENNPKREEELQEDVAFEPFLEEPIEEDLIAESNEMQNIEGAFQKNPLNQGLHGKTDDTVSRIQHALTSHHNVVNPPQVNQENDDTATEEREKNKGEGVVDQVAKKAAATGISAATGGVIPPKLAELGIEIINKRITLPQRLLKFLGFNGKIADSPWLSGIVVYGSIIATVVILIIATLIGIGREGNGKKEIASYLAYGILDEENGSESLVSFLQDGGWCNSTVDCVRSSGYRFLSTFRRKIIEKLEEYQDINEENECLETLNMNEDFSSLLLGTIFYNRSDDELLSAERMSIWKLAQYEAEMDYLIESLYQKEEIENSTINNTQKPEKELVCYSLSKDAYKEAIVKADGYIDRYRYDLGIFLSYERKLEIYEEIVEEVNQFMEIGLKQSQGTYIECSGITVTDENGNIVGTYSLEDYVAGVVSGEMPANFPIESKKALAVAARTYVLVRTNSCQKPIESSSRRQNFNPNIREDAREVTNATAGQILVDSNGNTFSTEYDSWNCKGSNTCTYQKKPNGEFHEVTISDKYLSRAAGGHGRGMSQIAAADMADKGSNYETILKFFYSDGVQLSTLTKNSGIMQGTKFTSNAPLHPNVGSLQLSPFYPNVGRLTGQCVWYARNRAQEILYYSDMPEAMKQAAINSIKNTSGNGEAWYRNPDGSIFAKSTDVTQPRAGAIVSWSGGVSGCTPRCGHVAIIESVNADGTVTMSEGWKTSKDDGWASASWSTVNYRTFTETIDYIRYHTNNSGDPYYFNGYVYLLG